MNGSGNKACFRQDSYPVQIDNARSEIRSRKLISNITIDPQTPCKEIAAIKTKKYNTEPEENSTTGTTARGQSKMEAVRKDTVKSVLMDILIGPTEKYLYFDRNIQW